MSLAQRKTWVSPEEYLAAELLSPEKHEYVGGEVYAIAGANRQHNVLAMNLSVEVGSRLRGNRCQPFGSDFKVRIPQPGRDIFYYPDLTVACEPGDPLSVFEEQPVVIFEVLSPSTEAIDRREKYLNYTSLPSVQAYVLVDQQKVEVTLFLRSPMGWAKEVLTALDETLELAAIGVTLPLAAIYRGTTLAAV